VKELRAWSRYGLAMLVVGVGCSRTSLTPSDQELSWCWPDCPKDPEPPCGAACTGEIWYSLGDSALGSWLVRQGGSSWGGGISGNSGWSEEPAAVVDNLNELTVAWADTSSGAAEIYVRRFNGGGWSEVGVGSGTGGELLTTQEARTRQPLR